MPNYIPIQDLTGKSSISDNDYVPVSDGTTAYGVRASLFKSYSTTEAEAAAAAAAASAAEAATLVGKVNDMDAMLNGNLPEEVTTDLDYEYHYGCIRSYDSANVYNGYVGNSSATWFANLNKSSSTSSSYANVCTYKIPISDITKIYTTASYSQVISTNFFVVSIADANDKHIAELAQNAIIGGTTPSTFDGILTYDSGKVNIDINAMRLKYPNAKSVFLSTARSTAASYISWYVNLTYAVNVAVANLEDRVDNLENGGVPYFVLPVKSYAVAGHEWNLYFDNVICGMNEEYDVTVAISPSISTSYVHMYKRLLRITPPAAETYTITLNLVQTMTRNIVETRTLTLNVVSDTLATNKTILCIGDSLTAAGIYEAEIQHNLNTHLRFAGTRQTTCTIGGNSYTVNHEGRTGWSAIDYTTQASISDVTNAFWDGSKFNFSYYMTNSGINAPSIVCIGLGTNAMGSYAANAAAIETMITSIHDYNSSIICLVSLITPPATQDGCGYINGAQSAANLKYLELKTVETYIQQFQGRQDNTDVYELYFNLDRENDYDTATIPLSSRNPGTWVCQINNVHPSEYGYLKFADVIYANLIARLV